MRAGFPHSDISGSMLVCQLPGAFRRLPRPSSPVIAKASTTCTCSLDPITLSPRALIKKARSPWLQANSCLPHSKSFCALRTQRYNLYPSRLSRTRSVRRHHASAPNRDLYFFQIFKEQNSRSTQKESVVQRSRKRSTTDSGVMVEVNGIEPMTSCLQSRRSPNLATPPVSEGSL